MRSSIWRALIGFRIAPRANVRSSNGYQLMSIGFSISEAATAGWPH